MRSKALFFTGLMAAALCLLAMGCHHEVPPAPVEGLRQSYGTATLNGSPVMFRSYISPLSVSSWIYEDSFLSLGFWLSDSLSSPWSGRLFTFGVVFIPVHADSCGVPPGYQVKEPFYSQCVLYGIQYFKSDYEEPCDRYFGADHADSWVKVLSYDAAAHQACLQFELHLAAEVYDCHDFPDTLHFTEGEICLDVMPR